MVAFRLTIESWIVGILSVRPLSCIAIGVGCLCVLGVRKALVDGCSEFLAYEYIV